MVVLDRPVRGPTGVVYTYVDGRFCVFASVVRRTLSGLPFSLVTPLSALPLDLLPLLMLLD